VDAGKYVRLWLLERIKILENCVSLPYRQLDLPRSIDFPYGDFAGSYFSSY
jgi:hypothetical protein